MRTAIAIAQPAPASVPGGRFRRLVDRTADLWEGLSYDEMIAVATSARERLGVGRPKRRQRVVLRLSREEITKLLEHAYRGRGEQGTMLKTLLLTGARVSEFVALRVEDFSYDDKAIVVRHGKGDKQRIVPILNTLADELRLWCGHRTSGPLFRSREGRGRPYSVRRVQQLVAELAAGAGITKRVFPHLIRHTIAQHLLEGGMPLEQVQRFLGHANITTTEIYAESSPAMIADGYRRALGGKTT